MHARTRAIPKDERYAGTNNMPVSAVWSTIHYKRDAVCCSLVRSETLQRICIAFVIVQQWTVQPYRHTA